MKNIQYTDCELGEPSTSISSAERIIDYHDVYDEIQYLLSMIGSLSFRCHLLQPAHILQSAGFPCCSWYYSR